MNATALLFWGLSKRYRPHPHRLYNCSQFGTITSNRKRKSKNPLKIKQQEAEKEAQEEEEYWRGRPRIRPNAYLWPEPMPDPDYAPKRKQLVLPKTSAEWKRRLYKAWEEYIWTFEGFLYTANNKDADNGEDLLDKTKEMIQEQQKEAEKNIGKNREFLRAEGEQALDNMKRNSGIHTRDDLKTWATNSMKLANECLSEFLSGYRKGRDVEVDKMINEYFQEEEPEKDAAAEDESSSTEVQTRKRRRKPKRRIRTSD